jgi:hypothetical protein
MHVVGMHEIKLCSSTMGAVKSFVNLCPTWLMIYLTMVAKLVKKVPNKIPEHQVMLTPASNLNETCQPSRNTHDELEHEDEELELWLDEDELLVLLDDEELDDDELLLLLLPLDDEEETRWVGIGE